MIKFSGKLYLEDLCENSQIVVLMDGKNELVGVHIFKLINKIYDHGYWMAYTSSYNVDEMKVGNSKQIS